MTMGGGPEEIERARLAVENGRVGEALPHLIEAWRATRAPDVAGLVERVALHLAPPPRPLTASQRRARQAVPAAEWRTLVKGGSPEALGEALATLYTRRVPVLLGRLALLAEARPDPRISGVVLPLIEDPRRFDDADAVRAAALEVFLLQRDVRFVEAFRQVRARLVASLDQARDIGGALDHAVADVGTWVAEALSARALEDLERVEGALVGRAAPLGGTVPLATLFAEVYRDPASTDVRQVLADRLVETGDPRGELIALQCGRTPGQRPSTRERELIEQHGRSWLGVLAPALSDGFTFERGFVARAALEEIELDTGIGTQPEWATLTHLDLWRYQHVGTMGLLLSKQLRALDVVRDLGRPDLEELAKSGPRRWTELGLAGARASTMWSFAAGRNELAAVPRIAPSLVRLRCAGLGADVGDLRGFCAALPALRELALGFEPERAAELWRMAVAAGLSRITLLAAVDVTFDPGLGALTLSCDEDARDFDAQRTRHPARRRFAPESLAPALVALRALAPMKPRSLTMRLPLRATLHDDVVTRGSEHMSLSSLRELSRELSIPVTVEKGPASP